MLNLCLLMLVEIENNGKNKSVESVLNILVGRKLILVHYI